MSPQCRFAALVFPAVVHPESSDTVFEKTRRIEDARDGLARVRVHGVLASGIPTRLELLASRQLFWSLFFSLRARPAVLFISAARVHSSSSRNDPPGRPCGGFRCASRAAGKRKKKSNCAAQCFFLFNFILFTPLCMGTKRKRPSRTLIGEFPSLYTPLLRQVCPLLAHSVFSIYFFSSYLSFVVREKKERKLIGSLR